MGGWSTTFAQLIGDTGAPLTNITSASQARFNSFFAKTDTENYIIESSRVPRGLTGYTETTGGINQAIIFNNTNLINTFGNIIDGMAKTKNANDIDQIVLNRGATIFGNSNGVFARGLRNWGGFAYYNLAASKVRVDNQFTGSFLPPGKIYSTLFYPGINDTTAAIAVKGASGVYAWGNTSIGGIRQNFATQLRLQNGTTGPFLTDIQDIYSNSYAFAVKGSSGVYVWGDSTNGGGNTGFATQLRLQNGTTDPFLTDVQEVYSNPYAFAVKGASGVYAWGNTTNGGLLSTAFATQLRLQNGTTGPFLTDTGKIYSTNTAFAVKGSSGIYAWGNGFNGGINTAFATQLRLQNGTTGPFLTDVQEVYSNSIVFAVKGSSGVYAWGDSTNGGLSTNIATQLRLQNGTTGPFLTDVQEVYANTLAFAVKGSSGVYAWGSGANGGISQNFATQLRLQNGTTGPFLTDVQEVYTNSVAFAVKGSSGVYAWGNTSIGGISQNFATQLRLQDGTTGPFLTDIQEVYSNAYAFAVKGSSGVYVWGDSLSGGIATNFASQLRINDSTSGPFLTGVDTIYGMDTYFVAKKFNEYYAWGASTVNTLTTGLNSNYATLVPIADFEEIIKPAQIENTDIELNSTKTTVGEIIAQAGVNVEGIAITKATNWRYKPSSSITWKTIEDVDVDNSLLLLQDTELEYITDAKAEPTLEFKAWNGEIGDEEDYLNTNIEYFNLVSDNTASVTVKTEPPTPTPSSDNSTLRIIIIAIVVAIAIIVLYFVIYYIWKYFNAKPSKSSLSYMLL